MKKHVVVNNYLYNILSKYLGIQTLNVDAQRFIIKGYVLIETIWSFMYWLTYSYIVLHVLSFINFIQLGSILAITLFLQAVSDYPTGVLSDKIGQRWIISLSIILMAIGYIGFAVSTSFEGFFLAYLIWALAEGQYSGSYETWFDNNYKEYAPEDANKTIYSIYHSRMYLTYNLVTALAFILGGIMVLYLHRILAFVIEAIMFLIIAILSFKLLHDHPNYVKKRITRSNTYINQFTGGIQEVWNNSSLRYVAMGLILSFGFGGAYLRLVMIPLYEGYSKTDELIGLLRSTIWLGGFIILLGATKIIAQISETRLWQLLKISSFFFLIFYYGGVFIVVVLFPMADVFIMQAYVALLIASLSARVFRGFYDSLLPRFYIEAVPDEHRNSVYSLIPTLALLLSVFVIYIEGILLELYGFYIILFLSLIVAVIAGSLLVYGFSITSTKRLKKKDILLLFQPNNEGNFPRFQLEEIASIIKLPVDESQHLLNELLTEGHLITASFLDYKNIYTLTR